ncbi:MAG: guanylate kinase [Candidatus Planktophila sp.]
MQQPPQLTSEERARALEVAKASRRERAAAKAAIHKGTLSLSEFLELAASNDVLAKMRVIELLESMPGYGKIRAQALMDKFAISPTRRVKGLGRHQRVALLKEFDIPSSHPRGRLLVLSGPGGVGKSTVAKALRDHPGFWVSVSATTRAPRFNEVHGVDYFYYSNEEFDQAIAQDEFLEWAEFAGNRYGTPRKAVEEALASGTHVLLEIEIAGARQVRAHSSEAVLVFLEPPSWEELVSRLEGRGTDSPERRAARLALAQEELAAASFFDSVIVNTQVQEVVQALIRLAAS